MRRLCCSIGLALFLLLLMAATLMAGVSSPDHDAYVSVNEPEVPHNTEYLVIAGSKPAFGEGCHDSEMTYLKWDLSHLSPLAEVLTASLTLTTNFVYGNAGADLALYAAGDVYSGTTTPWSEAGLTYYQVPTVSWESPLALRPAPLVQGQPVTFTGDAFRAYVAAQMRGDGVASFALRLGDGCSQLTIVRFDAREGGMGPELHYVTEIHAPDLAVTKKGPDMVAPGDLVTYTIAYSNTGNVVASQVVLTDTLPTVLLAPTVITSGATMTPRMGSAFVWDVEDLAPGAGGVVTITATVSPTFTGALSNFAAIATTAVESDTTNNLSVPVLTSLELADLVLDKVGPSQVFAGAPLTYTLAFSNVGTAFARQIVITDVLPAILQAHGVVTSSVVITPRMGSTFVWDVTDLAPGAGGFITLTAISPLTAQVPLSLTNHAEISTNMPEASVQNNIAETQTVLIGHRLFLPVVFRD